jgi:hypothetical protein
MGVVAVAVMVVVGYVLGVVYVRVCVSMCEYVSVSGEEKERDQEE